jgi:hypothetical protein
MNLNAINSAIDTAYNTAIANGGQRVGSQVIAPNVTIRTDSYVSKSGSGFRVICFIKREDGAFVMRVKNYGPDIRSEKQWPSEGIETALQNMPPPFYTL